MNSPIDAAASVQGSEIAMTSAVTPSGAPVLTEAATAALARISELQEGFRTSSAEIADHRAQMEAAQGADVSMSDMMERLGAQMESAARVNEQLVQFTMASSISSSFGRNLNTFLRGQ